MPPWEPQLTSSKMLAMDSSRDMLEKLKREIERLAGSIIRQEVVDHALNAAMTAWHLTDCTWREVQNSIPRRRILTARVGTPIKELKDFQEFVKRDCTEMAYCEGIAVSTRHFAFSKFPAQDRRTAAPGGLDNQRQAGRAYLATRGAEGPPSAAQARQALADQRILHPAAAGAAQSCLVL